MEPWGNPQPGGALRFVEPFTGLRVTVRERAAVIVGVFPPPDTVYYFDDRGALIARVDA